MKNVPFAAAAAVVAVLYIALGAIAWSMTMEVINSAISGNWTSAVAGAGLTAMLVLAMVACPLAIWHLLLFDKNEKNE